MKWKGYAADGDNFCVERSADQFGFDREQKILYCVSIVGSQTCPNLFSHLNRALPLRNNSRYAIRPTITFPYRQAEYLLFTLDTYYIS
jgi:hypothetical protein